MSKSSLDFFPEIKLVKAPLHERISNKNISKFIAHLSFFIYSPMYFI